MAGRDNRDGRADRGYPFAQPWGLPFTSVFICKAVLNKVRKQEGGQMYLCEYLWMHGTCIMLSQMLFFSTVFKLLFLDNEEKKNPYAK
jgi:hypothetical protein